MVLRSGLCCSFRIENVSVDYKVSLAIEWKVRCVNLAGTTRSERYINSGDAAVDCSCRLRLSIAVKKRGRRAKPLGVVASTL